jgi:hypothetical protein
MDIILIALFIGFGITALCVVGGMIVTGIVEFIDWIEGLE